MTGLALRPLRVAVTASLVLLIGAGGASAQQRVGVNSAVNPEATGTPPGLPTRNLVIGQNVVFNEHITTAAKGQTQLLFLDESAMTVGPQSNLTIDQFVYDPKSGTGKLAMSATRGLLRYVGGKLSKQEQAVTLHTNTATLAVRGGAFIAHIAPDGTTEAIFLYGKELIITGATGVSQTLTQPGFESTTKPGGSPSTPAAVPPGELAQYVQGFAGTGDGGATTAPSDANVVSSGLPQDVSNNPPTEPPPPPPPSPTPPPTVTTTVQSTTIQPAISNNTPPPVTITYAGRLASAVNTAQGFVDQSANGNVAYSAGTLNFPAGTPQQGVFTAGAGNLGTVTFPLVPGSASAQGTSSVFGNIAVRSFLSADNTFFYATITPISQPTQRLFISGGTPVNSTALQQTGATRTFAFSMQPDAALQSNMPFVRAQAGGNLPNASVSPLYVVAPATTPIGDASTASAARGLQASLAISGQGANQQSAIAVTTGMFATQQSNGQPVFNGQMRGSSLLSANGTPVRLGSAVSSTIDGAGNSLYGSNAISGFVLDQTAYSAGTSPGTIGGAVIPSSASETTLSGSATNYGFAQPALPQAVPAGVGASRTTQAMSGYFGGLMTTGAQPTPYIVSGGTLVSTDAANNRVQANLIGAAATPASGVNALNMQYGGLNGTAGAQAFVDDNTFAAAENASASPNSTGYFVSSGAAGAPASLLPAGASYCQCQYLKWGYWGGDLQMTSTSAPVSRIDRAHINTWVAGVPTPLNDLNTLMSQGVTGTYNGAAIGSVYNNGANYVAAGGFTGTYNFGTQSGSVAINNFDGRNFAASGSAPLTGSNYNFAVATPGVRGAVNGTFYGPMAAETGGSFSVQTTAGPAYLASGVFAGKR